jgi:hypothetical protein
LYGRWNIVSAMCLKANFRARPSESNKVLAHLETKRREKPGSDKKEWSKEIHGALKTFRKIDPKARFRR